MMLMSFKDLKGHESFRIHNISNLSKYLKNWHTKFCGPPITQEVNLTLFKCYNIKFGILYLLTSFKNLKSNYSYKVHNIWKLSKYQSNLYAKFGFPPRPLRSNYKIFNHNNFNIHYWSWNYCGCWHQTCPPIDPRGWS